MVEDVITSMLRRKRTFCEDDELEGEEDAPGG